VGFEPTRDQVPGDFESPASTTFRHSAFSAITDASAGCEKADPCRFRIPHHGDIRRVYTVCLLERSDGCDLGAQIVYLLDQRLDLLAVRHDHVVLRAYLLRRIGCE
jgi:hypothetical protein